MFHYPLSRFLLTVLIIYCQYDNYVTAILKWTEKFCKKQHNISFCVFAEFIPTGFVCFATATNI